MALAASAVLMMGGQAQAPWKTPKEGALALLPNLSQSPVSSRVTVLGAQYPVQVQRGSWDLTHSPDRRQQEGSKLGRRESWSELARGVWGLFVQNPSTNHAARGQRHTPQKRAPAATDAVSFLTLHSI